jgi:hypothetical protein
VPAGKANTASEWGGQQSQNRKAHLGQAQGNQGRQHIQAAGTPGAGILAGDRPQVVVGTLLAEGRHPLEEGTQGTRGEGTLLVGEGKQDTLWRDMLPQGEGRRQAGEDRSSVGTGRLHMAALREPLGEAAQRGLPAWTTALLITRLGRKQYTSLTRHLPGLFPLLCLLLLWAAPTRKTHVGTRPQLPQ